MTEVPEPRPSVPRGRGPTLYREPLHYDLLAQMTAPKDVPFYLRQVKRFGGPVLELGCGTGRVSLALIAAGIPVVGIDNSQELLAHAQMKAAASSQSLDLVEADFRDFDLGRSFPLIIFPYNAFNHLLDFDSIQSCFRSVQRHMQPGGHFIIDTFNPSPEALAVNPDKRTKILEYIDPFTRQRVIMTEANAYDAATQINNITWFYEIGGHRDARVDDLEMRIFYPQELDALLRLSGFSIEAKLGDYDEAAFTARSSKQIMILGLPPVDDETTDDEDDDEAEDGGTQRITITEPIKLADLVDEESTDDDSLHS